MPSSHPRSREERFVRLTRGETRGPAADLARFGLGGVAAVYGVAAAGRNAAYDRGWLAARCAGVPVVSVGNLTLGGTGKTPMVEWAARWFRARGVSVAVLSRGYARHGAINDEALVLEENLPDVPHLQDPDRLATAAVAVAELETELLLLDDGFQHRRLARDLDLVLLDALDPFGLGRLFPRGLLREPVGSLRRAGVVVLTRADLVDAPARAAIRARAERAGGPLRWAVTRHAALDLVGTGVDPEPLNSLAGRRIAAFCGIGNPEGFRRTVEPLVGAIAAWRTFPDHHAYNAADVAALAAWARDAGAEVVLTTQKDLVKLRVGRLGSLPLRAIRIGLDVLEGLTVLDDALGSVLPARREVVEAPVGP